jgi:hypothetical protein
LDQSFQVGKMLRKRSFPFGRQPVPCHRPAILKLLARSDVAGVFQLSHLSPEIAIGFLEQYLQATE